MNYEEMTDFEISCWVVALELNLLGGWFPYKFDEENKVFFLRSGNAKRRVEVTFDCNNPSDAWPIIMDKKIGGHYGKATPGLYFAVSRCERYVHADSNPLRAYMIVYLRMNEDNGH